MTEPAASERQPDIRRIQLGLERLYEMDFLRRRWVAELASETTLLLMAYEQQSAELARLREVLAIIRDERPSRAFSPANILEQVQALASITLDGAALASGRGGEGKR
jgi:hypothetical protein